MLFHPEQSRAELYVYLGPDGEKLVSDRPVDGYSLLGRRDTAEGAGHILAERPQDPASMDDIRAHIRTASTRYRIDPDLIEAIIQVESSFRDDAVSPAGATGLMQLMPGTAKDLEVSDRFNARDNIHGGTRYIRQLMGRFNNDLDLVIAAYFAGPGAVEKAGGIPPGSATRDYVAKVLKVYDKLAGEY